MGRRIIRMEKNLKQKSPTHSSKYFMSRRLEKIENDSFFYLRTVKKIQQLKYFLFFFVIVVLNVEIVEISKYILHLVIFPKKNIF